MGSLCKSLRCALAAGVALAVCPAPRSVAQVLVDNSPATTGVGVQSVSYSNVLYNDGRSFHYADQFTLAEFTTFDSVASFSHAPQGVGTPVRWLLYADNGGKPSLGEPLIDVATYVATEDDQFAAGLVRHVAPVPQTMLAAGTYWLTLAGNGEGGAHFDQAFAASAYDDGCSYYGTFQTNNLPFFNTCSVGAEPTDMFFQLGSLLPETIPGDYDYTGHVDGTDFLVWQRADGTPEGLSDWESNYGNFAPAASSAVSAVPEPATFWLLLVTLAAAGMQRRSST